jgi:hypothetical protein
MTYLLPNPGGAVLLRRTAGTRHAVQCGRTCGSRPSTWWSLGV